MNAPDNDRAAQDRLAQLVREAAEGVEPRDGLMAIRTRTRTSTKETPMNNVRTWLVTGLGGAVATAAVIGGVWLATNDDEKSQDPGPLNTPSGTVSETPTDDPTKTDEPSTSVDITVPAYYVAETSHGLRLYREFHAAEAYDDSLDARLEAAVCSAAGATADDGDYTAYWNEAGLVSCTATWNGDVVTIDLGDQAANSSGDLHDGSDLTAEERAISVEQLIYTAQAAVGEGRVPVQFLLNGSHTDQILGQPASEPLANGPVLETLSHVNISSPTEGETVSGDTLEVSGVGSSFEANFQLLLERTSDSEDVASGYATGEGWMGEKLFPFTGTLDISDVPPGTYTLIAMTDDASGGAEGNGPHVDSKIITIE